MQRIKEEAIILVSVVKWLALAATTGLIVGASTAAFVKTLNLCSSAILLLPHYFLLLPLGLAFSAALIYVFPDAVGHGANKVIGIIHHGNSRIPPINTMVEFLRTTITLAVGGSAGKEGPAAQIGAGCASLFADLLRFEGQDRRKLVICGISGAFASVFGTPIAGAIFGIEVLSAGTIKYDVLLPSFVAGIVSYQFSSWLGLAYFHHPVMFVPVFTEMFFLKVVVAGILFGGVSFLLVETLSLGKKISASLKLSLPLKGLIIGASLAASGFVLGDAYFGLGLDTLRSSLEGAPLPWYAFLVKTVFTSATLNFGGSGGIGTPLFFVGATSGNAFSGLLGVDPAMLAAIGFVSLLAGAANTPIAASIMAVELFGALVAPYAAVSCVISYVVAGHRSVYPAQTLAVKKSSSIKVEEGLPLEAVKARYEERENSVIIRLSRLWRLLRRDRG
ncbi:MAG: chloride channel protein [Deltaproteobacteria bacterium]|nr:chloride channel protein [Deltaproteobacteria bacterium]